MSTPCITSFGMMRKVQGLPGSVILIEEEPALSSGILAWSMSGMMASVASEHSSPMTTSGLILLEQAFGRLRRRQRTARGIFILNFELVSVYAGLVELLECELDALLVLHAEIGAGT